MGSHLPRRLPTQYVRLRRYGSQRSQFWHPWGSLVIAGIYGVLLWFRLQLGILWPESYVHWWRAEQVLRLGGGVDPARGLYPVELPLYTWLNRTLLQIAGIPDTQLLQGLTVGCSLLILLWCWGRGNGWSAALWGLSPWVLDWGLDPNPEILAAFLLMLGSLAAFPWRFGWLGLACMFSPYAWPLALALGLLWTGQQWHRYHWRGLGMLVLIVGLNSFGVWDQLGQVPGVAMGQGSLTQLDVLAPLMLTAGLALVRLGWPWSQRQQGVMALGILPVLGIAMVAGWWDPTRMSEAMRLGLVALPLLCLVAGGVLAEIPARGWRRLLGSLLLVGSLALTWQRWPVLVQQQAFNQELQTVAQNMVTVIEQQPTGSLGLMDSAPLVYFTRSQGQALGSGALDWLYGDPLPEQVTWLVVDQSEPGSPSPLLERYAEFAFQSQRLQWQLVGVYTPDMADLQPGIRFWQRQRVDGSLP